MTNSKWVQTTEDRLSAIGINYTSSEDALCEKISARIKELYDEGVIPSGTLLLAKRQL